MNGETEVSDEVLNAFADGELDAVEKARLLNLAAKDDLLRERVCRLWQLKETVKGAYPLPPAEPQPRRLSRWNGFGQAMAATLALAVGIVAGWLAHDDREISRYAGLQLYARNMNEGRVVLHLSSAAPDRLKAALDEADELAGSKDRAGRPVQVELVANGDGLTLLRSGYSPYSARIAALRRKHPNLTFIACDNTLAFLRQAGEDTTLLPEAIVAPSALDQIMMRLQQGWAYVRI
ncbi:MAG TPA: hypothetical protein VMB75_01340 [Rhodocyclaceae bacterium]|nr:hypothetical protein [Rhodocyclaceae bacterium]